LLVGPKGGVWCDFHKMELAEGGSAPLGVASVATGMAFPFFQEDRLDLDLEIFKIENRRGRLGAGTQSNQDHRR
jgi:hypothetical protein